MRYRENNVEFDEQSDSVIYEYYYSDKTTKVPITESFPAGYHRELNVITDVCGSPKSFNRVSHLAFKQSISPLSTSVVLTDPGDEESWNSAYVPLTYIGSKGVKQTSDVFPSVSVDHEFMKRAIAEITPSMESGFSGTNFVLELTDFSSMFKVWNRNASVFRNASSGTLNYNFGIKPFISDIKALKKGLETFSKRLTEFLRGANKPQRRHYTEREVIDSSDSQILNWFYTGTISDLTVTKCTRTKTATIDYIYTVPEMSEAQRNVRAMLDTLGAHLSLAVLWEAIPYSFVIDWFFNVGDFLKQFQKDWFPATIKVKRAGMSIKDEVTSIKTRKGINGCSLTPTTSTLTGKRYERYPIVLHDGHFSIALTGKLTLRKFFLGALLLEQRR